MALMLILRYFFEKKAFSLLAPPKQMSFLTSSHENVFFFSKLKAQDCLIGRDSCIQQMSAVAPDHFVDAPRI